MKCPSCNQNHISLVESIQASDLIALYKNKFDIDISYLIKESIINYYQCNQCDLLFFYPLLTGDEKFYIDLQKFDWYYLNEKNEYYFAQKYIKPSDHVLEIGSGSGFFTEFISPKSYIGLEFNHSAIKQATERGLNVLDQSIETHANQYPDTYNVVCSFQVLEHVTNIYSFVASGLKCLKKGGYLIVAVPNHDGFLHYCYHNILNLPPHHVSHWTVNALKSLASIHDTELIDIYEERIDEIHVRWFFRTFFYKVISDRLRHSIQLVDGSFRAKILYIFASLLARFIKLPVPDTILPVGHTVCVVYKKR